MTDNRRVNIRMGHEIYEWFEQEAKRLNVPVSSLMVIALNQWISQQTAVNYMPQIAQLQKVAGNASVSGS